MKCDNCGGVMELDAKRPFFKCEYCDFTKVIDSAHDGITLLDENVHGFSCPLCQKTLRRALYRNVRLLCCGDCRGFLISHKMLGKVLDYLRRVRQHKPDELYMVSDNFEKTSFLVW